MSQRVIVTGGSGGIGAAIVERFLTDGARVAVLDRRPPAGDTASLFFSVDLRDPLDTRRAVGEAIAALGGVDVLVNCAGVFQHVSLLDITVDDWDLVLDINARATLVTMQAAVPVMLEARSGAIVNIASMAAKQGGGGEGHYAASKAAVVALTRAGAQEWGCHGVRVNAVCPGYVLTDMGADTRSEDDVRTWSAKSPLGRLGAPEDVAGVTHFLASPAGGYLTGQAINVTGGMIMH
ncbi:3-oxoacyl-[acyl-carrier protein] reductase [Microbacterium sp. 1154]|uniref:SDR family NAD(P)-dependent oxidoreductase n=1 Tax=Microbacterium sp. 1154 TaxID=2817733 RepID=UPI002860040E|nr:SDR family NAD(P)-dependent oxidoreductase [Microbacterium sp. 1154]MDR6689834.1 3-oxoacyl-[acyl-carrier protein] reductase [Microbacterium sp. 1154]